MPGLPGQRFVRGRVALAGQAGSAAINSTSLIRGRDEPVNQSAPVGKRGFGLLAATGAGALAAHLLAARRFRQRTEALARQLGAQVETTLSSAREVPPIIRAFVQRAAAKDGVPVTVHLKQRAEMRLSSGGAWRPLTAAQVIDVHMPGFVWSAGMQLAPCVNASILDAYVDGEGFLEVRLFGSFPLVRAFGPEVGRGELMRYLAELVWAPQAMLCNPQLTWRAADDSSVEVSAACPAGPARVRFLFEGGDVVGFEADDRPRLADGSIVPTRWQGRCSDYRVLGGCRIPTRAVASWVLPEGQFDYWRGEITEFRASYPEEPV